MSRSSLRTTLASVLAIAGCSSPSGSNLFDEGSGADATSATSSSSDSSATGAATQSATGAATQSAAANTTSAASSSAASTSSGGSASGGTTKTAAANTTSTTTSGGTAASSESTTDSSSSASSTGGETSTTASETTSSSGGATSGTEATSTTGDPCEAEDERCDGLDNDCDGDADEDDACPEFCTGATFEGHDYLFCVQPVGEGGERPERTWSRAQYYCDWQGLQLPTIESAAENDFLYAELGHMDGEGSIWLAAVRDGDLWLWAPTDDEDSWTSFYDADAEAAVDDAFNDWGEGEPSNRGSSGCGLVLAAEDQPSWAADDCEEEFTRVVCEEP